MDYYPIPVYWRLTVYMSIAILVTDLTHRFLCYMCGSWDGLFLAVFSIAHSAPLERSQRHNDRLLVSYLVICSADAVEYPPIKRSFGV